jgi:DNA-directed RNA polymerase specialized sigma24 family protein
MTQAQFMECLSDAEQLEHFRRYCFYLAGNLADGDETANEALTRAWKHLASIENCDHLWKWLWPTIITSAFGGGGNPKN